MRRRLAIAIAGVAAGAVVLFAVPLGAALRNLYRDAELLRLERDTVAATRRIDITPQRGDPVELPQGGDQRAVYDTKLHVVAGGPLAAARPLASTALQTGRLQVRASGGRLYAAVPLLGGEHVTGVVVAERSASAAAADTRRAWLLLAALGAAVMLAALGAALLVGRRLSRRLERIAAAAGRLGLGDFSARAPRSAVPEVDAVAAALDATAERLDELVSRERTFSADASHQLRTPLAALRIELESAEMSGTGADPVRALRQVDRLEQTIATLLSVARDRPDSEADVDVVALADELVAEWRPRLANDGRPLWMSLDSAPLHAAAHEGVVREVLEVLLDNAYRHGAGAVTLAARNGDGFVKIDVADEGAGLGEDPEAAFERGNSARGGNGIGLALARSLAHAQGGRLLASASGSEPVLTLLLPAA